MSLPLLAALLLPAADTPPTYAVETKKDVAYRESNAADKTFHTLDLYMPKGGKDFPVLFFVHGGAWILGSKNDLGLYESMGKAFAKQGIGVVSINYRLSPRVRHPAHIEDVGAAFAWVHANVGKYGASQDKLFVCGHSAGGHLCALLAADDSYLKKYGLDSKAIRGVVPVSGVYIIPPKGIMDNVWGTDAEVRKKAGPIEHAKAGLPPFLILYADKDLPGCDKVPSERFATALNFKGVTAEGREFKSSDHIRIMLDMTRDDRAVFQAIRDFIRTNEK